MHVNNDVDRNLGALRFATEQLQEMLDRFQAEVAFARELCDARPAQRDAWEALISEATAALTAALARGVPAAQAVRDAEAIMAPIGEAAKAYTIHCVGHAHLDMNWLWNWAETVATVNDTYTTMTRLMEEFPHFTFVQSQGSIYQIMQQYQPRLFAKVKHFVRNGQWEITASQWVEGEKNLASGESLCRHLLYTRRFFKEHFGLPYDAINIAWEPDTFGHAHTVPTILGQGHVKRYFFCRAGIGRQLFWWQGKDGTRLLAFDNNTRWYNNTLDANVTSGLFAFEQENGLRDFLFVYGVGDHGGGPTRADLRMGLRMQEWPIFPRLVFSTIQAYLDRIVELNPDLPVVDSELNTIFEGCLSSESEVKRGNRQSENALVEAELCALLGAGLAGVDYPRDGLRLGWQHTLFNQFHDILPGSGVKATYEYAQGLYQEVYAQTGMAKTHALRGVAGLVDTAAVCDCPPAFPRVTAGLGLGAGMGDMPREGGVTRFGVGEDCCDPFVIFNTNPWPRSEVMAVRLWNRKFASDQIEVRDDQGTVLPVQVLDQKPYWWLTHEYIEVAFPVTEVPGLGYRTYSVRETPRPVTSVTPPPCRAHIEGIAKKGAEAVCHSYPGITRGIIENEFYRVEIEQESGALLHLIDKRTGLDFVPAGGKTALLEFQREAPHGMSAWHIGQILERIPLTSGAKLECRHDGPYLGTIRVRQQYLDSTFTLDISLAAGVPRVDFSLEMHWLERGSATLGMPGMKMVFPLAIANGTATFECPNGSVTRPANGWEVPAQKWVDLTGTQDGAAEPVGVTLLNDSKYAFSVLDNTIRMTLLRSSYDPDPLPEIGRHTVKFALQPHLGAWTAADATRAGIGFNMPFIPINTERHAGTLPPSAGFAELLTPNVMLSGMKRAEDSDALIVRLYETDGRPTTARLRLAPALAAPNAPAMQTDVLEVNLPTNTATLVDGVLEVNLPAFGMTTVKIG